MTAQTYPITGIPTGSLKPAPLRQEVSQWWDLKDREKNKLQVSLFIQALAEFKAMTYKDKLSYYQVAGIHSYPLQPWDSAPPSHAPDGDPPGYCAHNVVTFPTWHRPYMALYEQRLYEIMNTIIQGWKGLTDEQIADWRFAAFMFRLPYWDWAAKQTWVDNFALPQVFTMRLVTIFKEDEKWHEVDNPLWEFSNPMGRQIPMGDKAVMGAWAIEDNESSTPPLPWSECIATSRYGITDTKLDPKKLWVHGINDWVKVNQAMKDPPSYAQWSGSFADAVSRMFSPGYFDSWETFATTLWNNPATATNYLSIEYIHNILHNTVGGQFLNKDHNPQGGYDGIGLGHMSDVPVAAFDPIFWLHHSNIDRQLAIFQQLNPTMWFDKPHPGDYTPDDALQPFHYDTQAHVWTSNMCKNWQVFRYQYDDLQPPPTAVESDGSINAEAYRAGLQKRISELYPGTSEAIKRTPGYTLEGDKFNDYIINVVYDRYALKGRAYTILFFIGDPPDDLSSYKTHDSYVGCVYTFSNPVAGCSNCKTQASDGVLSKAQVALTIPLMVQATRDPMLVLGPLEPEVVKQVLHVGLNWRFVELGGKPRPNSDFPRTKIAVYQGQGQHPRQGAYLPTYGGYVHVPEATEGKELGTGPGGDLIPSAP